MSRRLNTAVFGTGFVGRVHLEGIRRLGFVELYGHRRSRSREGPAAGRGVRASPRSASGLPRAAGGPGTGRGAHLHAQRAALSRWSRTRSQAGKHVICEKPLSTSLELGQELVELAARQEAPQLHLPQPALLPHGAAHAPHARSGRTGRDPGGAGHLLAGLAALRHRLELAHRFQGQRPVALHGRHRLALLRHGRARHRAAHHLAVRGPADLPQDAQAARRGRSRPSPARRCGRRITRKSPIDTEDFGGVVFRMGDRTRGAFTASQVIGRPQEPPEHRDLRHQGRRLLGPGAARRAVDRPSQQPQPDHREGPLADAGAARGPTPTCRAATAKATTTRSSRSSAASTSPCSIPTWPPEYPQFVDGAAPVDDSGERNSRARRSAPGWTCRCRRPRRRSSILWGRPSACGGLSGRLHSRVQRRGLRGRRRPRAAPLSWV